MKNRGKFHEEYQIDVGFFRSLQHMVNRKAERRQGSLKKGQPDTEAQREAMVEAA